MLNHGLSSGQWLRRPRGIDEGGESELRWATNWTKNETKHVVYILLFGKSPKLEINHLIQ